jgi:hypothetical protein
MSHFGTFSQHAVLIGVWLFPTLLIAQEESGGEVETQTQEQQPPADELTPYQLDVKYARTRMLLAKAELLIALETNQQVPGTVAKLAIERLRSNLAVAEEQLHEAELASVGGQDRIRLRHAEEKIRLAKMHLENGRKLQESGMISELELDRLRLKYEFAKLHLVILKRPQHFSTLLHYLESKVDRLGEEILDLDQRLSKMEPARSALPESN